ncbi:hypothetical protein CLV73_3033 [Chryseobacterium geocarposphaerae]|uniref:Uncharacterized protein n=1 Tax=Chryseobacterium geocarposphaerae TaxID=1416776 RepID=A0A2M9C2S9_9FLAO|nr:hypothetical protein CLV73_3033 [Chryseobacterium geocarposphaerae]
MIADSIYFLITGLVAFFQGRNYYNNANEIYYEEYDKAISWIRQKFLFLYKPSRMRFLGCVLMLLGVINFFLVFYALVKAYF